ncbi:hypothetical protein CBR_g12108 [Chara braunii]|uniref:RING-type E3 ubiquitin transferase n=1 Tax=Chara braunii TaxID=69332 RepID=A0A388KR74_CHABU|nr:hypothetical protein CBR_g12108 [Chara braunii]|eukprot:GBG72537.1 hypothetical protein CBR_g12108 [Chara braunii]
MDTLITSESGMGHIFVIVDRFSKYARLVAMLETAKTEYVIRLFKENWVRDLRLPKSIVSDRDVRFTSELWKAAAPKQGTQLQMTSGNHPEANGQAEQLNRAVQHLLRHYIKPNQVDWDEKLALIASLYNNVVHSATGALGRSQRELQGFEEAGHDESDPQVKQLKDHVEKVMEIRLCYESQLRDTELLQMGLSYYRLMVVWMANLLGGFRWPLPAPCPMEFASLPEHFVEDMAQLLLFASRIPHAYDGVILDEFMSFIVTLMGSPLHIKNPYLRAKFVAVLNAWMPAHCMTRGIADSMATLFEGHQLALECMVPNLLKLYVDIEFTGSHTQFFDKFEIRHNIAELLEYLWEVPSHNMSWKKVAKTEERGFYLRFLNMLVNDAIYLLDESLNKLPELRDLEEQMKDKKAWESIPEDERREKERYFRQMESMVRYDMMVANYNVRMLQYTSAEISTPFLLPEMIERIAAMLNYFLLQLVGPQRKALKVRDPEKYEFRPKELLTQIVDIYLNLERSDLTDKFAVAVSSDGRSYRPEAFPEAAAVLRSRQLRPEEMIRAFESFGEKVKVCAAEAMDVEAMMGDIPDEFLDPIQFTLMNDPVVLPSSKTTIDRAVIQRHLLSDQTDPFNRSLLTPDMLIPNTELKAKIEAFREAQRRKAHS